MRTALETIYRTIHGAALGAVMGVVGVLAMNQCHRVSVRVITMGVVEFQGNEGDSRHSYSVDKSFLLHYNK
jgi:hypothetical protein